MTDEERFAAELDMAFDDYDALPKAETPVRSESDLEADAAAGAASRTTARRGTTTPVRSGDDDWRAADAGRDSGGLRRILLAAAAIAGLLLVLILLFNWYNNRSGSTVSNTGDGGGTPTAVSSEPTPGAGAAGGVVTATEELPSTSAPTSTEALTSTPELTPTAEVTPGGPPPTQAPPPTDASLAAANPQPVPVGGTLESNGWSYSYPNATYAAAVGSQVGSYTANGSWVLVLVHVANNTGTDQPIPPDFFVLKDAQGRVYHAQPQVSSAYVVRGVNADISMEDSVPANGLPTSMPLLFDVPHGATNLVLFASSNPGQGWPVLDSVP
jgi:hypothetical protein